MNINIKTSSALSDISTSRICLAGLRDIPSVHAGRFTPAKSKSDPNLFSCAVTYNSELPEPSQSVPRSVTNEESNAGSSRKKSSTENTRIHDAPCVHNKLTSNANSENVETAKAGECPRKLCPVNNSKKGDVENVPEKTCDGLSQKPPPRGSRKDRSSTSEITLLPFSLTKSNISLPPDNSSSSTGGEVCRICMTCGRERLISPCFCKGSLGLVHVNCLERWLSLAGRSTCELCGFRFPVLQTQRYSLYRALTIWFSHSRNRTTFQNDCLFFWMLSILTTALVVCCALGSRYFMEQGSMLGVSRALAEGLSDVLMLIVLCAYAITTYALWKDHATIWRRWRSATMDVRLVLEDQTPNMTVHKT